MNSFEQKDPSIIEGNESSIDVLRKQYSNAGFKYALETVKENSERGNLYFHNQTHTSRVRKNSLLIAEVLGATEQEKDLIEFTSGFHDYDHKSEEMSTKEAEKYMRKVNEDEGVDVFSEEDISNVGSAIDGTVYEWNDKKKTVIQPNIEGKNNVVVLAIALADIGTAGIEGSKKYKKEGDDLFRENNVDILEKLEKPENLSKNDKENFIQRMLEWSEVQVSFAQGRKNLFEHEIDIFEDDEKNNLRELFSKFDDSIEGAKASVERRKKMSFEEIAEDLGYELIKKAA